MLRFKVCLLGETGVGKTSLINRFVRSLFSDSFHSTVGAKVDQKSLNIDGRHVELMIWDLAGGLENQVLYRSYLRGSRGIIYVADGSRLQSLSALDAYRGVAQTVAPKHLSLTLVNKSDMEGSWKNSLAETDSETMKVSAKTGERVEEAFEKVARMLVGSLSQ